MTVQDKTFTQEISDVCLKYFWLKERRRKKDHIWAQIHIPALLIQTSFLSTTRHSFKPISKNIIRALKMKITILSLAMKTSRLITFGRAGEVFFFVFFFKCEGLLDIWWRCVSFSSSTTHDLVWEERSATQWHLPQEKKCHSYEGDSVKEPLVFPQFIATPTGTALVFIYC